MRIENMKIPPVSPEERKERIEKKLKKQFGFVPVWKILRRSVDARRKDQICFVYTLDVEAGAKSPAPPAYEPWPGFSAGKGLPGADADQVSALPVDPFDSVGSCFSGKRCPGERAASPGVDAEMDHSVAEQSGLPAGRKDEGGAADGGRTQEKGLVHKFSSH